MREALVAGVLLTARLAVADELPRVDVQVGQTVERNVGYVRGGWMCDDPTLVHAELVTRGTPPDDHNAWIVTGAKPGTTQCRVGTDRSRPALVFEVHVAPAKSGRP